MELKFKNLYNQRYLVLFLTIAYLKITPNHTTAISNGNKTLCDTYTYCYQIDLAPKIGATTSKSVAITSTLAGIQTFHQISMTSIGSNCINPTIDIIFEEIDFATSSEYFDVFDENGDLISQCSGHTDSNCGEWLTCLNQQTLSKSQINENETYTITIEGTDELHKLCQHEYSLNIILTITCSNQPRISCGTNTWCYYVNLYPTLGTASETVAITSESYGVATDHQIYITSIGADCLNPTINVKYEEIDFDSKDEYFDVYVDNNELISRCNGTQQNGCEVWGQCIDNIDLPISSINRNETYQMTIEASDELHPLCDGYSFHAKITISCNTPNPTPQPTTSHPTSYPTTFDPTFNPTTPSPTANTTCNISLDIVHNWPISKLNGWSKCYDEPYSDHTYPSSFSSCAIGDGYYLFVGAKSSSSTENIHIGAYGPSSVINITTSSATNAYKPSWYSGYNVFWYYYPGNSFGFSPVETINLNSADTSTSDDSDRLSWHFGQTVGGYRAGSNIALNSDTTWRKIVYYKQCVSGVSGKLLTRRLCGTDTWCYYVDLYPTNNITSESVSIISETDGGSSYHHIYMKSNGYECINPVIDVIYEEIDFDSVNEYFDVFDNNDNLISRCYGSQQDGCGVWGTCLSDKYLSISQIDANDTFNITIEGSAELNSLCSTYHSYSLNAKLTITCGGG